MKFGFWLSVIIVVIRQGVESMRVIAEGPEAVQVHVGTGFQRHAGHHYASGQSFWVQALGTPEECQILKVLGIEKDRTSRVFKVLHGVENPHGQRSVEAVGEGGKKNHGVSIGVEFLHKWTATGDKGPVPVGAGWGGEEKQLILTTKQGEYHRLTVQKENRPLAHFSWMMLGFAVTRSVLTPTCFS